MGWKGEGWRDSALGPAMDFHFLASAQRNSKLLVRRAFLDIDFARDGKSLAT